MAHVDQVRSAGERRRGSEPDADAVIGAATRLYLDGAALDMSVLAAGLGLSRATLYRRVGNRDELLGAVLARQTEATFRRVARAPDLHGVDAVLDVLGTFMADVVASRPLRALIARDALLFVRVVMGPGPVESAATALVAELVVDELGPGLPVPPDVLAHAIVRICDSFMYSHLLARAQPESEAALAVTRLLLESVHALRPAR